MRATKTMVAVALAFLVALPLLAQEAEQTDPATEPIESTEPMEATPESAEDSYASGSDEQLPETASPLGLLLLLGTGGAGAAAGIRYFRRNR